MRSAHTFSKDFTTLLVRVMRILWIGASSPPAFIPSLNPLSLANDMFLDYLADVSNGK